MIKLISLLLFNIMGAAMFYFAFLFDYGAFELFLVGVFIVASGILTMTVIGGEERKK